MQFRVAEKSDVNLMTIGNLGVCFGPTLLRPEEETVASIMDLKFYSVVIDILIENHVKIFKTKPESNVTSFSARVACAEREPIKKTRIVNSAPVCRNNQQQILVPKTAFQVQVTPPQPVTHVRFFEIFSNHDNLN